MYLLTYLLTTYLCTFNLIRCVGLAESLDSDTRCAAVSAISACAAHPDNRWRLLGFGATRSLQRAAAVPEPPHLSDSARLGLQRLGQWQATMELAAGGGNSDALLG